MIRLLRVLVPYVLVTGGASLAIGTYAGTGWQLVFMPFVMLGGIMIGWTAGRERGDGVS
jgi:hypothetical protein